MKLKKNCMFFNAELPEPGRTPDWGQELGQTPEKYLMKQSGCSEIINGMLHNKADNNENFAYGSGGDKYSFEFLAIFEDNAIDVYDAATKTLQRHELKLPFILLIVKETSGHHIGRRTLKVNKGFSYDEKNNLEFYNSINEIVKGPWFGYELNYDNHESGKLTLTIIKAPTPDPIEGSPDAKYISATERKYIWTALASEYVEYQLGCAGNNYSCNLILYGPPGTGKTFSTKRIALSILNGVYQNNNGKILSKDNPISKSDREEFGKMANEGRIRFVTFHQSYSYEDFVEGIKPVLACTQEEEHVCENKPTISSGQNFNNNLNYEVVLGIFRRICFDAQESGDPYVLIIDEINRGNISKIFGELITLIEDSKRLGQADETKVILPYSQKAFGVPKNLFIIGTMNTADKSIALIDTALRRRFSFIEFVPEPYLLSNNIDGVNLEMMLTTLNQRIRYLLDDDHRIGHTYFLNIDDIYSIAQVFKEQILPLLTEYFYGDYDKMKLVLGDEDIGRSKDTLRVYIKDVSATQDSLFKQDVEGFQEKICYSLNPILAEASDDDALRKLFVSIYNQDLSTPDE
jgi:hypothetical protein